MTVRPIAGDPTPLDQPVELCSFWNDDGSPLGDVESLPVGFSVKSDDRSRGNLHVLVDDRAPDFCVSAHPHSLEEHALLDFAERIHPAANAENAPVDATARDNAAVAHHRVGRNPAPGLSLIAKDKLRRGIVRSACPDRPALVVKVELRVNPYEIHWRFPVDVNRSAFSPVAPILPPSS